MSGELLNSESNKYILKLFLPMIANLKEIKEIRKKLSLTQSQLAKRAQVSQSLIAKIEAGILDPTFTNATKIFNALSDMGKKAETKAEEIMTTKIVSVLPKSTVKEAITKMKSHGYSQLPVITDHKVEGLISESIILEALLEKKGKFVEDIMIQEPPVISSQTAISALSTLLKYFPMVLVSKKGKISGVITRSDILSRMYKS